MEPGSPALHMGLYHLSLPPTHTCTKSLSWGNVLNNVTNISIIGLFCIVFTIVLNILLVERSFQLLLGKYGFPLDRLLPSVLLSLLTVLCLSRPPPGGGGQGCCSRPGMGDAAPQGRPEPTTAVPLLSSACLLSVCLSFLQTPPQREVVPLQCDVQKNVTTKPSLSEQIFLDLWWCYTQINPHKSKQSWKLI